ncbi:DUF1801 domain-containing protein [Pseudoflavitalea sp. X16]|uniref:DUF1801 domain-containing protein n=1 Tax=Paraflavitalea devenefica TaxID=2716334 RepID=UPI0014233267|nr:DUF1801 domain-containing protein [Paraflavitalea devenefica]NII23581.1 DUF1801 domain-containing protein [Paraflavitalea devenefica]
MAKTKTTQTDRPVKDFISEVDNETKRDDSYQLIEIFKELTGFEPKMWGPSIVGFGSYHYKYASGHEGDAPLAGFSPRKDALAIYLATDFNKKEELLKELGKHKMSVACLYVKKLEDIKLPVLKKLITNSVAHIKKLYPDK